jgi:hypothetical protein
LAANGGSLTLSIPSMTIILSVGADHRRRILPSGMLGIERASSRSTTSIFLPADQRGCDRILALLVVVLAVMRAIITLPIRCPTQPGAMEHWPDRVLGTSDRVARPRRR